jgi:hypothetical protein
MTVIISISPPPHYLQPLPHSPNTPIPHFSNLPKSIAEKDSGGVEIPFFLI